MTERHFLDLSPEEFSEQETAREAEYLARKRADERDTAQPRVIEEAQDAWLERLEWNAIETSALREAALCELETGKAPDEEIFAELRAEYANPQYINGVFGFDSGLLDPEQAYFTNWKESVRLQILCAENWHQLEAICRDMRAKKAHVADDWQMVEDHHKWIRATTTPPCRL